MNNLIPAPRKGRRPVRLAFDQRARYGGGQTNELTWYSQPGTLLPPGFSLTRASANATYFDSAGLLQTAATDVARGTYRYNGSAWVFDGTMIEQAATNLAIRSNAFTTTWSNVNVGSIAQNVTGIDGATSAWTVTDSSAVAVSQVQYGQVLTAATYTQSIYVKKTTGAQASYPTYYANSSTRIAIVTVDTSDGVATVWSAYTGLTVTTTSATVEDCGGFWRVRLTFLADADAGGWFHAFSPAGTTNATQSTGAMDAAAQGSAVITCAQLELGSAATSYIATGAASATRNADVVTATTSGLLVNAQGFAAMEYRCIAYGSAAGFTGLLSTYTGGAQGIPIYNAIGSIPGQLGLFDGSTSPSVGLALPSVGAIGSVATTWGGIVMNGAVNGVVGTPQVFDGSMDLAGTLRIGNHVSASDLPISMVLQSLRLGLVAMSASQLSGETML